MTIAPFIFDRPACPTCGTGMNLARRQPHPTLGPTWERVTYECAKCGAEHTRALQVPTPDKPAGSISQSKPA
jgi:hypothetical protein